MLSHRRSAAQLPSRRSHPEAGEQLKSSKHGGVAQLGERSVRIREVEGSNPFVSTTLRGQVGEQPAVQLNKEHPCYSGVFLSFCTNYTLSWQADATQIAPDFGLDMLSQIW